MLSVRSCEFGAHHCLCTMGRVCGYHHGLFCPPYSYAVPADSHARTTTEDAVAVCSEDNIVDAGASVHNFVVSIFYFTARFGCESDLCKVRECRIIAAASQSIESIAGSARAAET